MDYLERILKARVYDVAIESGLDRASRLSERLDNIVLLKREDQQPVFSFKLRGAFNRMRQLTPAALKRGVACSSAGNHAQGVALAARHLGCEAVIIMPATTPEIKIQAVRSLGGKVILHGDTYDEAQEHAQAYCDAHDMVFVHPYDDPEVIAGQGTIAVEILRQMQRPPHAVFVPIGGGGLISGIAVYLKTLYPNIRCIGVEPNDAPSMYESLKAGKRVTLKEVGQFADGVAVKKVGKETFRLCQEFVDEVILVNTDETCAAIKDIFEDTRSIVEPAGALGVAGMKKWCERHRVKNRELVALTCGANMNFDRLRHVAERAELGEQREAILAVTIPEKPGSFKSFCRELGKVNITEFNYRYSSPEQAHVFVGVSIAQPGDIRNLSARLRGRGFAVMDLSANEAAKLHLRHLVGGHAGAVAEELFYRFEFPERPGALMAFLEKMPKDWNISLFHYRNHGTDYGRVLVGMQVPPEDANRFESFLQGVGYPYTDETANQALRLFLC